MTLNELKTVIDPDVPIWISDGEWDDERYDNMLTALAYEDGSSRIEYITLDAQGEITVQILEEVEK